MTLKSCLAVIVLVLGLIFALGSAEAAPAACPAKSTSMDDIIASLKEAKGCDAAMKVFEACEYVASGDVQFGEVVERKGEADFLGRANSSKKQDYKRELGVCDRSTGTSPAPCTSLSPRSAGRRSPSVIRERCARPRLPGRARPRAGRLRPRARPWPSRQSPGTPPAR